MQMPWRGTRGKGSGEGPCGGGCQPLWSRLPNATVVALWLQVEMLSSRETEQEVIGARGAAGERPRACTDACI
eukprot:134503-Chlamydomonas_euryale.AAC.1